YLEAQIKFTDPRAHPSYNETRDRHSFPTRRSSDLPVDKRSYGRGDGRHGRLDPRPGETGRHGERDRASGTRSMGVLRQRHRQDIDRKSTRLNSSHVSISYAVFCLKKKMKSTVVYSI